MIRRQGIFEGAAGLWILSVILLFSGRFLMQFWLQKESELKQMLGLLGRLFS